MVSIEVFVNAVNGVSTCSREYDVDFTVEEFFGEVWRVCGDLER